MNSLEHYLATAIAREPEPPRHLHFLSAVPAAYFRNSNYELLGLVGILTVVGISLARAFGVLLLSDWVAVSGLVLGVVMFAAPAVLSVRAWKAGQHGLVVQATVTDMILTVTGSRSPLDPAPNGVASGKRRVAHPRGEYVEAFEFDGQGAATIVVGSQMSVLVDPNHRRTLFDLGPGPQHPGTDDHGRGN